MACRIKWLDELELLGKAKKLLGKLLSYLGLLAEEIEKTKGKTGMISLSQIKSLITEVCTDMGEKFASKDAINLLVATGIVESRYEYLRQMGDGPARSFWQVEAATAVDNLAHYLKHRPELMKKCAEASMVDIKHWQNFDEKIWEKILEKNIAAGIVHARLKYWRVPKRMPNTHEGQADYWKKYYNTEGRKGDPEEFVEACKKYLS